MRTQNLIWLVMVVWTLALGGCGGRKQIKHAESLAGQGRYTEALSAYRRILAEKPDNPKLQARLEAIKGLEAQRLVRMGTSLLEAGEAARAFEVFADATRYDSKNAEARAGLERARDAWADRADLLESDGELDRALDIFEKIAREFRNDERSRESIKRIRRAFAERDKAAGKQFLEQDRPANALVEFLKARRQVPEDEEAQQLISSTVERLKDAGRFTVAIAASRRRDLDLRKWKDALELDFRNRRIPVFMVDDVRSSRLRLQPRLRIGRYKRKSKRVVVDLEVPDGETIRPNPEYEALKVKVDASESHAGELEPPVRELQVQLDAMVQARLKQGDPRPSPEEEALEEKLDEVSGPYKAAVAEFQALSVKLARLPVEFREPKSRTVSYTVREITTWIELQGQVTAILGDGGAEQQFDFDEETRAVDRTNRKLRATKTRPEIGADPLELPDRKSMTADLEAKARSRLAEILEQLHRDYTETRWSDARRQAMAGHKEEAVEMFLYACMADPRRSPDEAIRYILAVKHVSGLPLLEVIGGERSSRQGAGWN